MQRTWTISQKKRLVEVEAVFGQLKFYSHFTRFTLKGVDKVNIEAVLMAIAHNLRKLVASLTKKYAFFAKIERKYFDVSPQMMPC